MRKNAERWEQVLDYIIEYHRDHIKKGFKPDYPRQSDIARSFNLSSERIRQIFGFLIKNKHIKVDRGIIIKILKKNDNDRRKDISLHKRNKRGDVKKTRRD